MIEFSVLVLLSEDFRKTCMGYNATAPYREAIRFKVQATDEKHAAEVAFAICNSSVEFGPEMHCHPSYMDIVREYREAKNRSLSVGDAVEVDGTRYACEAMGWDEVGS